MKPISIALDKVLLRLLDKHCFDTRQSRSALVRGLLKQRYGKRG